MGTLTSECGLSIRLTQGQDDATYAMVLGKPRSPALHISGLPEGPVELLGVSDEIQRNGNTVTLPGRLPEHSAITLRIS